MIRILLVHGDSDDRQMYAEYFRSFDCDVIEATTTNAAPGFVADVDVMVSGLAVPGSLPAPELIAGATSGRWGKRVPVVVVTACVLPELHKAAYAAGADAVLLKPCYPHDLLSAVRKAQTGANSPAPSRVFPRRRG